MVITISREFGAGGSIVAKAVADALGWRVVDNEFVERVAARAGMPQETVAEQEEWAPGFLQRLARVLTASAPPLLTPEESGQHEMEEARIVRETEAIVRELALEGRKVLVGRAAPVVLGQSENALHVRLVAPKAFRVEVAAERLGIAPAQALRLLEEKDASRLRYHQKYYQRDARDPLNYDLVINTGRTGFTPAARLIVERARQLGW